MNSKYEATLTACNQLDKVPSETSNAVTFAAKVQGISRQEYWSKLYERVEKKTYDAIDDYWQSHHQAEAMRTQLEKELWEVYRTTYLPQDPKVLKDETTGGAVVIDVDVDVDSIPPLISEEYPYPITRK